MPFIQDILQHKSLSIVGLAKNTGKTESLNYVLKRLQEYHKRIAVTSIGIDGESIDQVTQTAKPEIEIFEGNLFITSEMHYKQKQLVADIINVSKQQTSLGRLITARAVTSGKVILSGPASTQLLKSCIREMENEQVDLTIVDGALSRLSLASPTVTEAMILATGAALSANIPQLVRQTKYVYDLINLEEIGPSIKDIVEEIDAGVWALDTNGELHDLNLLSGLMLEKQQENLLRYGNTLYVPGVVSDYLLNHLRTQKQIQDITVIAKDFTKIFAGSENYNAFIQRGGKIRVLEKTKLIAITINPVSPTGYVLNSSELAQALEDRLHIPVYNLREYAR